MRRQWREHGRSVENTSDDIFTQEMDRASLFKLNNVLLTFHLRQVQEKGKDKHGEKIGHGWRIEKSETRMWSLVMMR